MLTHLSNTSHYVCDLKRGPIEPANRMASTPSRKMSVLLEKKESYTKQTRTPLKLLSYDEVPMDSTAIPMDINASLQPVWYTEQTIVDEQLKGSTEDIAAIIRGEQQRNSSIYRKTLSVGQNAIEDNELPRQSSLMHKSSTFTIERDSSMHIDSDQESVLHESQTNHNTTASVDDSFRALEHLLGLGSTTTVRESPKTNHDTLSLTVVTPTDIINATTISLRTSFMPTSSTACLPIPVMPTIESINSTMSPSFLPDDEPPSILHQQTSMATTDNDTIKDDSTTDEETNFSFELSDFPDNSNDESSMPLPPAMAMRAPTCADVAYRALVKPRMSSRVSQPVKADSPLAQTNKIRSSAPTSRLLRSSCRRASTECSSQTSIIQEPSNSTDCLVDDNQQKTRSLVQVITLPDEDEENQMESTNGITLNLSCSNETPENNDSNVSLSTSMLPLLSREYTYTSPKPRSSQRCRRSMLTQSHSTLTEQSKSPSIPSKSILGVLLTDTTELTSNLLSPNKTRQSERVSSRSPARVSIKPLHSTQRYSLQMVSIGEEEQMSIPAPPPPAIDDPEEEEFSPEDEQPQIDLAPLNDTLPAVTMRTMDIGIQTTPSLNASLRRQLNTMEQQTTPQMKSVIVEQQITPIQTKAVIHLTRNVRFQLTPTTDARLAEKEKLDEHFRGLKPEIVFSSAPMSLEIPQKIKTKKNKAAPQKKVLRTRATRTTSPATKIIEKPKPISKTRLKKKTATQSRPEPTIPVAKRAPRKRPEPITHPLEPVVKRAKTTESTIHASSDRPRTRSRSTVKASKTTDTSSTVRHGKRRLPSSERTKTTGEQKSQSNEINQNLTKIETLTVAGLKTRLNTHQVVFSKDAKKADLVALLINIETNLFQKQQKTAPIGNVSITAKRTRRAKK